MNDRATRLTAIHRVFELLGRDLNEQHAAAIERSLPAFSSMFELEAALLLSKHGLDALLPKAMSLHLFLIHNARLKLVRYLLPAGKFILDLGGANSPLHEMGYPHDFDKMLLVDLPLEARHSDFQVAVAGGSGRVFLVYEDMTDLSGIESGTVDLVWSGQSIEHVSEEDGRRICREAFRVLRPGGHFCLDTPNRLITELHTEAVGGGFIHPDHKIEYTPNHLRTLLLDAGLLIVQEWGICEMPLTVYRKNFTYEDFLLGGAISKNIDDSYIQFFDCVKPA